MRIAAAVLLATTLSAQPSTDPLPPGRLTDIGGRRLHLNCTGNGSQTVIIENGGGAFSIDWSLVQPEVSKFARVCTYDRAGYAWSDPGPAPDMVGQTVDDLHLLLRSAKLSPPYILVGASIGGFYARAYQRRFTRQSASGEVSHAVARNDIGAGSIHRFILRLRLSTHVRCAHSGRL